MASERETLQKWIGKGGKFIKLQIGQSGEYIFRGMQFDATGGFQGKPTVKYKLEEDGDIKEMSSSSKVFARQMMQMKDGDTVRIVAVDKQGKRLLQATRVAAGQPLRSQAEEQKVIKAVEGMKSKDEDDDIFSEDGDDTGGDELEVSEK